MMLPPALAGERLEFGNGAAHLNMYMDGNGPALLLVHSINAAASAAEVRPLYAAFARTRTVFALELPGFGLSERSDRHYGPRLMTDAILAGVEQIRSRTRERAVDALALSLSCEFLARAAAEHPDGFRSLAFVSPTGLSGRRNLRKPAGATLGKKWLYRALRGPRSRPGWGRTLYGWLTRPNVIRYFLKRTWGSPNIDHELWQYDILAAQQPGAEYAPLYFLAGELFSADLHTVYDRLQQPIFLGHGVRGDFTNYSRAGMLSDRSGCRLRVYQTGALPFFEVPEEFCRDYDAFLREVAP